MSIKTILVPLTLVALLGVMSTASLASPIMYGGLGGHSNGDSTNDGSLAIVNQTTGAVSIVGHPAGVARISGLEFDSLGNLFGATQFAGGFPPPPGPTSFSNLIRLDPNTGALLSSVPIAVGGVSISIADLAVQPGTNTLYGIRGPTDQLGGQGLLYTINTVTGAATLIGNTGDFFGSIAFSPTGTLYMSAADLDFATGNIVNTALKTLNPNNAASLSSVPTLDFFGALGIRPTDGVIFGGTGDQHQLFTINAVTGGESLLGDTGSHFVGDLAFQPTVPEPSTLTLMGVGLVAVVRRIRGSRVSRTRARRGACRRLARLRADPRRS